MAANKLGVACVTQSMTISVERTAEQRRVRVWFGAQPICDYLGDADEADRYERAMRRRFSGLRVTNETVPVRDRR